MRTAQDKIMASIDSILADYDLEGVRDFWQSNSGTLHVQDPKRLPTVFRIAVQFDTGKFSACIMLNHEDRDYAHIPFERKPAIVEHRERAFHIEYHDGQRLLLFMNCVRAFARAAQQKKNLAEVWP